MEYFHFYLGHLLQQFYCWSFAISWQTGFMTHMGNTSAATHSASYGESQGADPPGDMWGIAG